MVAPTDWNKPEYRGQTFKGFVQFQIPDGSTWYRLKERQTMSFNMNYGRAEHYADDGRKFLDPSGSNHSFTMTIKLTSDMFDDLTWVDTTPADGFPDTLVSPEKNTLSYWIYKNERYEPIDIIFVTSFNTLSGPAGDTSDSAVNLKFVLDPSTFSFRLDGNGGSPEVTIGGTVKSITNASRASTTDQ